MEVYWIDYQDSIHRDVIGTGTSSGQPMCVVPAGCWQAARPLGEYSLLGCSVAPGFEFTDFEMLSESSPILAHITSLDAALAELA
jgi:uncharacterized protein